MKPRNNKEITERKRQEGKDLGGRPRFQIDYRQLAALCGRFNGGEDCAAILGCSYDTLNLRLKEDYREALEKDPHTDPFVMVEEKGKEVPVMLANGFTEFFKKYAATGRATLRKRQFEMATDEKKPNATMLIWLGKNELGQTDKIDHLSSDRSMSPAREMSDDELRAEANRRGLPARVFH